MGKFQVVLHRHLASQQSTMVIVKAANATDAAEEARRLTAQRHRWDTTYIENTDPDVLYIIDLLSGTVLPQEPVGLKPIK